MSLSTPTHLLYLLEVSWRHDEDEVSLGHYFRCQDPRPVAGQNDFTLHSDEERAVGSRYALPSVRAGTRDLHLGESPPTRDTTGKRLRQRAAASIPGANEENVQGSGIPKQVGDALSETRGGDRAGADDARTASGAVHYRRRCRLDETATIQHPQSSAGDRISPLRDDLISGHGGRDT